MKTITLLALFALTACGAGGEVGAECTSDEDCAEGLECHFHEHHDDGDTGEAHEEEEEEHGECEAHE